MSRFRSAQGLPFELQTGYYLLNRDEGDVLVQSAQTMTLRRMLVYDSFDRADRTSGMGNAETGQSWQTEGSWGISNNRAYNTVKASTNAVVDSGASDAIVRATLGVISNFVGIVVRVTDENNFIRVNNEAGKYQLTSRSGGTYFTLGSSGIVAANGDQIEIACFGLGIRVMINGSLVWDVSSAVNQRATKHGMRSADTVARFDNFSVEAI